MSEIPVEETPNTATADPSATSDTASATLPTITPEAQQAKDPNPELAEENRALKEQLAMYQQGQMNPMGPGYNNPSLTTDDSKQTGTPVVPPPPEAIGYHPHEGDHSIDPFTRKPYTE